MGSSRMYTVFPVDRRESSVASFTRWASPPERVVEDWPILMYPSPTEDRVSSFRRSLGRFSKKARPSSTVMSSTS